MKKRDSPKFQVNVGYAPIICRMTIDGTEEEFSTSKRVHEDGWDIDNKKSCY